MRCAQPALLLPIRAVMLLAKHCYLSASSLLMESHAVISQRCCMSRSVNFFKSVYWVARCRTYSLCPHPAININAAVLPKRPRTPHSKRPPQQPKVLLSSTSSALLLAAPAPAATRRRVSAARRCCFCRAFAVPVQQLRILAAGSPATGSRLSGLKI